MVRALVGIDRTLVDGVDERRSDEGAQDLGADVAGNLAPGEPAPQGEGDRHRRIDVGPADPARHVDGEGDREAPSPADEEPVAAGLEDLRAAARLVQARDGHRDDAVAEADEDEGSDELGDELAGCRHAPRGTRTHQRLVGNRHDRSSGRFRLLTADGRSARAGSATVR